jgi:signal transduction histidine kinase
MRRTLRIRLAALYGLLFFVSSVGLVTVIMVETGWQFPAPPGPGSPPLYHVQRFIVLGLVAVVSLALGWVTAGRMLRPLRTITKATREISEDDLHRRLAMPGPGNELKDLADTIDGLLARLQAAFDAQRTFIANAAHELRTPLTLERAMIEVALADRDATAETLRRTCERVLAVGQQQEQLIEALLTLARSQRGLDRRELLDLGVITEAVLESRSPEAAARGLVVTASIATAPVRGDARLLERLAANLIDNAIRHNVPHGQIDIQVTTGGGQSRLKIANTGPVIPADQASRLLQPFERLPGRRTTTDQGLGLGLSIVAAIAKAHHATLTLTMCQQGGLDVEIGFTAAAGLSAPRQRALAAT